MLLILSWSFLPYLLYVLFTLSATFLFHIFAICFICSIFFGTNNYSFQFVSTKKAMVLAMASYLWFYTFILLAGFYTHFLSCPSQILLRTLLILLLPLEESIYVSLPMSKSYFFGLPLFFKDLSYTTSCTQPSILYDVWTFLLLQQSSWKALYYPLQLE